MRGSRRHIEESAHVPVGNGTVDFTMIRISQSAVSAFVDSHGGGEQTAAVQLRFMLEDFLLRSARRPTNSGYVTLAHSGCELILTRDGHVLLGYRTVHRERTWAQLKGGVPSRFPGRSGGKHRRAELGPRPGPGDPITLQIISERLDPASIHLTWRVRGSFSRIAGLGDADDQNLDQAIRSAIADSNRLGTWSQRSDGLFELAEPGLVWLVSQDAKLMVGVRQVAASRSYT